MAELAQEPLLYYLQMNGVANELNYFVGHDNPGCFLKVNGQPFEELQASAADDEAPEFSRGDVDSDFRGHLWQTIGHIYAGEDEEHVEVLVKHNNKNGVWILSHGKK